MMKLLRAFLLLFVVLALCGWTDAGFNFRATSGYATDGANEVYVLKDAYPTTRGGVTFGWVSINNDAARDRDNSLDRRLAGVNFHPNNETAAEFKVDLTSAGSKTICLAIGDPVFDQANIYVQVLDNSTVLFTINKPDFHAGANFYDASGTDRTAAAWPGSQTCVTHTFATTTFRMLMGNGSGTQSTGISHIRITDASSGSSALLLKNARGDD